MNADVTPMNAETAISKYQEIMRFDGAIHIPVAIAHWTICVHRRDIGVHRRFQRLSPP